MNSWREIWITYFSQSSVWRMFLGSYLQGSWADRIFLAVAALGFVVSSWCYFVFLRPALFVMIAFECVFLIRLFILKDKLVLSEFGEIDQAQPPPDTEAHRDTRYLMFKKSLLKKGLTRSHVMDCFDLADMQIDIASTSGKNYKKFFNFSIGVFLGVLGTLWHSQTTKELLYACTVILSVGLLGTIIISAFPSKIERLKEMKYFMKLFCREGS